MFLRISSLLPVHVHDETLISCRRRSARPSATRGGFRTLCIVTGLSHHAALCAPRGVHLAEINKNPETLKPWPVK